MKLEKLSLLTVVLILLALQSAFAQQIEFVPLVPSSLGGYEQKGMTPPVPKVAPQVAPKILPLTSESLKQKTADSPTVAETTSAFETYVTRGGTESPPSRMTESERLIATSSFASNLPDAKPAVQQFGYDIFSKPPSTFAPTEQVPVGPGYVVGPDDEIRVALWGKIEGEWSLKVDRDGNINIPKVGIIGVTGLTFKELKEVLHKEISRYYTGFEMSVTMGALRTVRVYIVGNVTRPGAFTVSSLATLVNALIESGGPSKTGSMRKVELKRNGKTVVQFDMYDLLLKGDKTKDFRLMPEDVIFVPPIGPLAAITGNVKRPAIYELKGETRLIDLIEMAGGITGIAFKGRVQLQRIHDHQLKTIFEGDLVDLKRESDKNFVLEDWDIVRIFPVLASPTNIARITGAVASPGEFGIAPGTTKVKDLLAQAGGLLYYASEEAEVTRVRVTQAGPSTERFMINLKKAVEGDPAHNVLLEINDYLFVRAVPDWQVYRTVTVSGEVPYPGVYTIKKGERLSSLLERAGGYTDKAYLRGAVFIRDRVRELQAKSMEEMIYRLEKELLSEGSMQVSASLSADEVQARKTEIEQKQKFIETLKRQKALGRMTVRLAHMRLLKGSEYDIELEENDSLHIPSANKVVGVVGAVMSNGSFIYIEKMDYTDYIDLAGSYSRFADESRTFVLKVDGSAMQVSRGLVNWNGSRSRWEAAGFSEPKAIEPGDTIVVPEKLSRVAWLREIKDITQIMMQLAVTAGVVIKVF